LGREFILVEGFNLRVRHFKANFGLELAVATVYVDQLKSKHNASLVFKHSSSEYIFILVCFVV